MVAGGRPDPGGFLQEARTGAREAAAHMKDLAERFAGLRNAVLCLPADPSIDDRAALRHRLLPLETTLMSARASHRLHWHQLAWRTPLFFAGRQRTTSGALRATARAEHLPLRIDRPSSAISGSAIRHGPATAPAAGQFRPSTGPAEGARRLRTGALFP